MRIYIKHLNSLRHLLICLVILSVVSCKSTKPAATTPPKPSVQTPSPKPEVKEEVKEVKKEENVKLKVVLIMPFELEQNFAEVTDETIEPEVSQTSLSALNFYEGALIATDSLKSHKKEVAIHTFDTPADSSAIFRMFSNAAVKEANFVIGTFPANLNNAAVTAASKYGVNLILTQSNSPEVLENHHNIALSAASTISQCREMAAFMLSQFEDSKIILVYRTEKREDQLASAFREEIIKLKKNQEFSELNATTKSYKDIATLLSKTKRNLIFLISSDEAFISPVISLVEEQKIFGIKLAGLPTWQNFESIDFMSLKNIEVYIFDNNFISLDTPLRADFRKTFISKYSNDPLNTAYNGFDLIFHIGNVYENNDKNFGGMLKKAFPNNSIGYSFEDSGNNGLENKSISVLRFFDYKLEKVNDK
jgi:ABC-type branched-subunit amino acid transport system substrate-binding protein